MPANANVIDEFDRVLSTGLNHMRQIMEHGLSNHSDMIYAVRVFLISIVSCTFDFINKEFPTVAKHVKFDIKSAIGHLDDADAVQAERSSTNHVVSNLSAVQHVEHLLSMALLEKLQELPPSLREPDVVLCGLELLLVNLISQECDDAQEVLDNLYFNVNEGLNGMAMTKH